MQRHTLQLFSFLLPSMLHSMSHGRLGIAPPCANWFAVIKAFCPRHKKTSKFLKSKRLASPRFGQKGLWHSDPLPSDAREDVGLALFLRFVSTQMTVF